MKINPCTFASGLLAVAAATTAHAPRAARAQDAPQEEGAVELTAAPRTSPVARRSGPVGPLRFFGGFRVGVGGNFVDMEDDFDDLDADPTVGIQMGVDYVVMDYFAIGAESRFNWAKVDGDDERIMLWDLVVKPRGRYQLTNLPLELYGATPFGLSVANFDNDPVRFGGVAVPVEINGGAGATFGLLGGANYFFDDHMGINAEVGAMFHWIHGEVETTFGDVDLKMRLAQMALLQINFVYAL